MTDDDLFLLVGQLQRHEGVRLKPYQDTVGKWTIGYGRNLSDRGISDEEADYLLANDMNDAEDDLQRTFQWFRALDSVRQAALVNICFNMGLANLRTFKNALAEMAAQNYVLAAGEFAASRWASQVGQRAVELCAQIRTGKWMQ